MNTVNNVLSEIIADNIRNGKCRVITLDELESWSSDEKQASLPVRVTKKIWITVKTFFIKLRKVVFGW